MMPNSSSFHLWKGLVCVRLRERHVEALGLGLNIDFETSTELNLTSAPEALVSQLWHGGSGVVCVVGCSPGEIQGVDG